MNSTLCAITETWLPNEKDDQKHKEVPPLAYKITSHPCSDGRRGGGIAIVCKNNLKIKDETPLQTSKIMEYKNVSAYLRGINFDVYVIYCYPGSSVISFCEELTDILENNITKKQRTPSTSRGLQYSPGQSRYARHHHIPRLHGLFWVNKSY